MKTHAFSVAGLSRAERNAELQKLERNREVVAIGLDAWPEGVISGPTSQIPQVRNLRIFDKEGKFLGNMLTPPVSLDDAKLLVREAFGDDLGMVQNLDGDYKGMAYVVGQDNEVNEELAKELKFASLLVRPINEDAQPTQIEELTPAEQEARKNQYDRGDMLDKAEDAFTILRHKGPGALIEKILS